MKTTKQLQENLIALAITCSIPISTNIIEGEDYDGNIIQELEISHQKGGEPLLVTPIMIETKTIARTLTNHGWDIQTITHSYDSDTGWEDFEPHSIEKVLDRDVESKILGILITHYVQHIQEMEALEAAYQEDS